MKNIIFLKLDGDEEPGFNFLVGGKNGTKNWVLFISRVAWRQSEACRELEIRRALSRVYLILCHGYEQDGYQRATRPFAKQPRLLASPSLTVPVLPDRFRAPALERKALPPGWSHLLVGTPAMGLCPWVVPAPTWETVPPSCG